MHRTANLTRSLVTSGVFATLTLFAASCSDSSKPAATPAPAKTSAAAPAATTPVAKAEPAAAAKSEAPVAKPVVDVVAKTAAAGEAAQRAATEAAKASIDNAKAAVDPHAGHDHAANDTAAKDGAKVTDTKDKIQSLLNGQDPQAEEVDPNSKARLTYEFGSDNKNFGKVMQGDILKHTFVLKSGGEEDLVIKQAKPTCGCTVAQVMVEQADGTMGAYTFGGAVAPGRKVELNATLHTQNKHGHSGSRINIFTNDPRGQTQLGLEADVDTFFLVNPPTLNFNQLASKDTVTDKVSISTAQGQRVKLMSVLNNVPPGLKAELTPLDADADGNATRWELSATAGPGLVEGSLAYSVPLKSDVPLPGAEPLPNGQAPTYEVAVTIMGQVLGTISYNPSFVSLGLIRPGQVVSRTVRVTSHDPEFKLAEPKVLVQGRDSAEWEFSKYFSSVVRPVAGENAVDVELRLDGMPDTLNGSFSGMMVLQIGYADKPELKLPITGVCRGGVASPVGGTPAPK